MVTSFISSALFLLPLYALASSMFLYTYWQLKREFVENQCYKAIKHGDIRGHMRSGRILEVLPYAVISPNGARHSLSGIDWLRGWLLTAEKLAKPTTPLGLGLCPATNSQLCYGVMFVSTPQNTVIYPQINSTYRIG